MDCKNLQIWVLYKLMSGLAKKKGGAEIRLGGDEKRGRKGQTRR